MWGNCNVDLSLRVWCNQTVLPSQVQDPERPVVLQQGVLAQGRVKPVKREGVSMPAANNRRSTAHRRC